MGQQYLIDSNALIDYLSGKLPADAVSFLNQVINDIPNISVITKIEVLGFKTTREASTLLSNFIDDSIVFGLSDEIVEQTIALRKEHKIKTPDAIIAATALVNNLSIISRNITDFKSIQDLGIVNPYDL
ncbi:MAG: type II toxin-antitoxin system VapC family toxin [Bacteroidales bacterium]|nr:type II toxin-antitoxin system VapC family toxin [Bacteroidales bacterium]